MRMWFITVSLFLLAGMCTGAAPVGWRTDGTGQYPQAVPPTTWSADQHIIWKTALPDWGNASPVLVGDRLFVCTEPSTLLCVSATDGRILWQQTNNYADLLSPEELAESAGDLKKADELNKQISALKKELKALQQDDATAKAGDLQAQIADLQRQTSVLERYRAPKVNRDNGYASPTPVSDGAYVYVLFGTGIAACYDLQGHRRWITLVARPNFPHGHSASPVLAGGKLLVNFDHLRALDPATGKTVWEAPDVPIVFGTPVIARLGTEEVAVCPSGHLVRVRDGAVLSGWLQTAMRGGSPIVQDGVAYFLQPEAKAVTLPADAKGEARELWATALRNEEYFNSPVYHDGLLYVVSRSKVLAVVEASTGRLVYEQPLDLPKGIIYSITAAGDFIYLGVDDGTMLVLKPGRQYQEVARNTLEPFRSSPIFAGTRMYLHAGKSLYCIGE